MAQNFLRGLLAISGASEVGGGGDMLSQVLLIFFFSVLFGWNQYVPSSSQTVWPCGPHGSEKARWA